jgi:hypothetical protein
MLSYNILNLISLTLLMWREFREKKNPFTGNGKILTKSEWTKLLYHCQKFRNSPCLASGSRPSLVHTFESYMTQKIRKWEVQNFITTNTLTRYATTYPSSRNKVDCGTPSNLNCNNTRKLEVQGWMHVKSVKKYTSTR